MKKLKKEWIESEKDMVGKQCQRSPKIELAWTTGMVAMLHKQGLRLNEIAYVFSENALSRKAWEVFLKKNCLPKMNATLDMRDAYIWSEDAYDRFDLIMVEENSYNPLPVGRRAYRA